MEENVVSWGCDSAECEVCLGVHVRVSSSFRVIIVDPVVPKVSGLSACTRRTSRLYSVSV